MNWIVLDNIGRPYDLSPWKDKIEANVKLGRTDIFERTPIGRKADGTYFFWADEEVFIDLQTASVNTLISAAKPLFP